MNVGSLGNIVFETSDARVLTLQSFSLSREAQYEEHSVLGSAPRSEFVHSGLCSLDMEILLSASLGVDPWYEAKRLDDYCTRGSVLRLVLAGVNLGKFTLRSLSQEWKYLQRGTDRTGRTDRTGPQQINITIQLKEYV